MTDLAVSLGYKDGDRFEVEWDVEDNEDDVDTHWWGATLLPYDGRVKEQVAVRTLKYDPYPEGGFPEYSSEDVIFLSSNMLADPETRDYLNYRKAGSEEEYELDSVECTVNSILEAALSKNKAAWNTMSAAQQADIASKIALKKQKLVSLLQEQTGVVTSQGMQAILAKTMSE